MKKKVRHQAARPGTLSVQVMDMIGRRIVRGSYRIGAVLPPEFMLCEKYGVSRTPLREAMKKLHAKGLIAMAPKSGTRVLPEAQWNQLDADLLRWRFGKGLDDEMLEQLYELRAAFEPEACRLAAQNGSPEDHAAISRCFADMEAKHGDPAGIVEPDIEFHMAIVTATQNRFLITIGMAIRAALKLEFRLAAERRAFPAAELDQHRIIRDAIVRCDGERAEQAMKELIALSRASLTRAVQRVSRASREIRATATRGNLSGQLKEHRGFP